MEKSNILVTGGMGFIGSHTVIELIENGYNPIIYDNLSNSKEDVLDRLETITGIRPEFFKGDIRDADSLDLVFSKRKIDAVIHFAGLKAVGESVKKPLLYYQNNVGGSLVLFEAMANHGVKNIIFSSSATVYGDPAQIPITENCPLGETTNPYGTGKAMIERMLKDLHGGDNEWNIMLLRYFNPIGAHKSGLIGEDPNGIPNNLVPYVAKVADGQLDKIHVFGNDYDTPDGTGVRDYIHVVDLARGHISALRGMEKFSGVNIYNLGTGKGYSVLEVIKAYSEASGKELPYVIDPRRSGDVASCYSDPSKAEAELGWKAERSLDEMCADSWNWQRNSMKDR